MDYLPDVVRIEPAGLCNFRCRHCVVRPEDSRGLMDIGAFTKVLDNLWQVPRVMVFYHGGEPLLNKQLPYMIAMAKGFGVNKTVTQSNASRLNRELACQLCKAGLDEIRFSFDGESPEENDALRVGADFEHDSKLVIGLLTRDDRPKVVIFNTRFSPEGDRLWLSTPGYLWERFGSYDVTFRSNAARAWPGWFSNEFMVEEEPTYPQYCNLLWETVTILANGNVVPCCEDLIGEAVMGNIFAEPLPIIWSGETYTQFRNRFRKGDYPDICRRCYKTNRRRLVRISEQA